jgi:hypothetical protein
VTGAATASVCSKSHGLPDDVRRSATAIPACCEPRRDRHGVPSTGQAGFVYPSAALRLRVAAAFFAATEHGDDCANSREARAALLVTSQETDQCLVGPAKGACVRSGPGRATAAACSRNWEKVLTHRALSVCQRNKSRYLMQRHVTTPNSQQLQPRRCALSTEGAINP